MLEADKVTDIGLIRSMFVGEYRPRTLLQGGLGSDAPGCWLQLDAVLNIAERRKGTC